MTEFVKTEDVLARHHLEELFAVGDEYDGPDLDDTDVVMVCDGEWRLEPDGELWRFWRWPDDEAA